MRSGGEDKRGAEGCCVAPHVIRCSCPSCDNVGLLNDVTHGMAAVVELCRGEFLCACGVEGEKEDTAFGAEDFFISCRVPAFVETFGVKDDEAAACLEDFVSTDFFAGAHKGGDASASWA